MPGEEVWLMGECRVSANTKILFGQSPADADLKTLAAIMTTISGIADFRHPLG